MNDDNLERQIEDALKPHERPLFGRPRPVVPTVGTPTPQDETAAQTPSEGQEEASQQEGEGIPTADPVPAPPYPNTVMEYLRAIDARLADIYDEIGSIESRLNDRIETVLSTLR